jgi:hypothetical protein
VRIRGGPLQFRSPVGGLGVDADVAAEYYAERPGASVARHVAARAAIAGWPVPPPLPARQRRLWGEKVDVV